MTDPKREAVHDAMRQVLGEEGLHRGWRYGTGKVHLASCGQLSWRTEPDRVDLIAFRPDQLCDHCLRDVATKVFALLQDAVCMVPTTSGPGAGIPGMCGSPKPCPIHNNPALNEVRA